MARKIYAILLALLALLALSGCYKVDGTLAVDGVGQTISGQLVYSVDEAFNQAVVKKSLKSFHSQLPKTVKVTDQSKGKRQAFKYDFQKTPIAELNKIEGLPFSFSITPKDKGAYAFFIDLSSTNYDKALLESKGIKVKKNPPSPKFKVALKLPTEITTIPEGLKDYVKGNKLTLTNQTALTRPGITYTTAANEDQAKAEAVEFAAPKFGESPKPETAEGVWPIPNVSTGGIFPLIFTLLMAIGGGAMVFGHFGNVDKVVAYRDKRRADKGTATKKARAPKVKKSKR